MPFQITWDNPEQDLILVEFSTPFTWKDFHTGIDEVHQRIEAVGHKVDMIIGTQGGMPSGFALPQFRTAFQTQPPNIGLVFVIPQKKATGIARRFAKVLEQVLPGKSSVIFVESVEQARQALCEGKADPV